MTGRGFSGYGMAVERAGKVCATGTPDEEKSGGALLMGTDGGFVAGSGGLVAPFMK